ncbi:MAG TPA: hypothetical protein VNH64_06925, partial [Parvularculaceae bacterium]|nr:hypothetical protein [Parvularculaceae bacterium]
MTRFLIGFGLCVLLVLTAVIGFYRLPGGALRANIAFDGRCSPLQGVGGADDLEIDPMKRRAFVSSFSASASGSGVARGAIAAFSIDDPLSENAWSDRTLGEPAVFAPLGLHLYQREGARRLFVVNAAAKSVELYDVGDDGALSHVETFTERRLTSPND